MTYEAAGIAAMLPGMIHAHRLMGEEIEQLQARLAELQNGDRPTRGRPRNETMDEAANRLLLGATEAQAEAERKFARRSRARSGWWTKLTPAERSAEMKRRYQSRKDRPPTGRPAGNRGYWAKMTKEERQAEMRRRAEVRRKNWAKEANLEKLHPRDARSPRHEEWLKTMSKAMKASHKKRAAAPAVKMQHVNGEATA